MVWSGDLLLFTDATGIYIPYMPTKNTAAPLGASISVWLLLCVEQRIPSLNRIQLSGSGKLSLGMSSYELWGCLEADPDL